MTDLSIIIVSYNTKDLLRDCLNSIKKSQKPIKGIEIIVVDNNSSDGSQEMVKKEFESVKLIKNEENLGFATANNQGVTVSNGKYLLFLNSDTKLFSNSLVKPLKYLKKHPKVGALTIKLVLANGAIDKDNHRGFPTPFTAITKFTKLANLFPGSPIFNNYYQSYKKYDKTHSVDVVAGSYLMMSKKLFQQIGGWDENYFFYGEDIDICYRVHQAGKQIVYYPKVKAIHYKGASSGLRKESKKIAKTPKKTRLKVARSSTQAMKIFYRKFYQDKYPPLLTKFVLTAISILGQIRLLKHRLT